MEHGGEVRFEKGPLYTRGQIREIVGGSARAAREPGPQAPPPPVA